MSAHGFRPHCVRLGPAPPQKVEQQLPSFRLMSCGQTVAHLSYCWGLVFHWLVMFYLYEWVHFVQSLRGASDLHMVQLIPLPPATQSSLASLNPDLFNLSGASLPRLSWKKMLLNGCLSVRLDIWWADCKRETSLHNQKDVCQVADTAYLGEWYTEFY